MEPKQDRDDWLKEGITAYWRSQALYVAAKLGVADMLAAGLMTVEALAQQVQAHPDRLRRLLRALASEGVFAEQEDGRFALPERAEPMRDDASDSMRPLVLMMGEEHDRAWGELLHSVRSGETAFEAVHGQPIFNFLAAQRILTRVRAAMPAHGRVRVAERGIPRGNKAFFGKWWDLTRMTIPGGRERAEAEYRALLESARLSLTRAVSTRGEISVVEGAQKSSSA